MPILTSANATDWAPIAPKRQENLYGITFGNGRFVAVGCPNAYYNALAILTSETGLDWTRQSVPSVSSFTFSRVAYGNGSYVALGNGINWLTSTNGTDWVKHDFPESYAFNEIVFAQGVFVAVGYYRGPTTYVGVILTSPDGISWTRTFGASGASIGGVTYGDGLFVATLGSGVVMISSDGKSWSSNATGYPLSYVAFAAGRFVAQVIDRAQMLVSTNAVDWVPVAGPGQLSCPVD